jgi:hypothetical protein
MPSRYCGPARPRRPSRRLHADLGSGSIGRSTSHAALWLTHAAIAYSRTPAGVPCDPARARPALPAAPRHRARRLALLAPLLLAERLGLAPDAAGTKGTHRQYSPAALAPSGPVDGILRRLALCASALEGARTQGHARTHSLFRIGAYRRAGVGRTCCSRARASTRPPARCRSTAPRQAAASLQTKRSATSRICGRCDGVLGCSQGSSDKGTRVAHRTSSDIYGRARRSHTYLSDICARERAAPPAVVFRFASFRFVLSPSCAWALESLKHALIVHRTARARQRGGGRRRRRCACRAASCRTTSSGVTTSRSSRVRWAIPRVL